MPRSWGALDRPTAAPPASAIVVLPGESIQNALSQAQAMAGWVVLESGTHQVSAPLDIPSGVTLAGRGATTVLAYSPALTQPLVDGSAPATSLISSSDDDLHDVTIRDLSIDCGAAPFELNDPHAPLVSAIWLVSLNPPDMQNLRLEHVSASHCTMMGAHIKGAQNLVVEGCDFSANGGAAAPKYYHNLYIRRITHGVVSNSRLDDSPFGNGLNISYSRDVIASCNEASRNGFRGIRAAEVNTLQLVDNVTDRNGDCGLVANAEVSGCQNVTIERNTSQHNLNYGLQLRRVTNLSLGQNTLGSNGKGEIDGP
jgi:hypothetical protein